MKALACQVLSTLVSLKIEIVYEQDKLKKQDYCMFHNWSYDEIDRKRYRNDKMYDHCQGCDDKVVRKSGLTKLPKH